MIGGALETVCHYLVTLGTQSLLSSSTFPLGTIIVNVLGCYLLAFLAGPGLLGVVPPAWHLALGAGFLGAFTTFSTFGFESHALVQEGGWSRAVLYVLANLVLGHVALLLGRVTALRLSGGLDDPASRPGSWRRTGGARTRVISAYRGTWWSRHR